MDQIGKMYQNRAMVLQEEVNRLERLLLEVKSSRQIPPGEEMDFSRPTPEQRQANQLVGGGVASGPLNPGGVGDDIMSRLGNAALDSPYWTTGIGLAGAYALKNPARFVANMISPNRLMTRDFSPEAGGLNSPYNKPTRNLEGGFDYSKPQQPRSPINWFDAEALRRAEKVLKERGEQAQAVKAAEEKAAKAAQLVKDQAAAAKSYDLTKDLASKSTMREPPEIINVVAGKPIYGPGRLTPEGQVKVGETQEGIYPYEKPGAKASAEMQSGQMRRQAVSDLSSEAREATKGVRLGNAAAALEYPQAMTGRQVAGKILSTAGKFIDPVGEAASTALGIGARALGAAGTVAGGAAMLPMVISLFDRQAGGQEQAGSAEGPPIYTQDDEDLARKYAQNKKDMEKLAKNPSGRYTPEPQTQSERDDITNSGYSNAVTLDQRRTAAKNSTRRGEYSTLQDRPQQ